MNLQIRTLDGGETGVSADQVEKLDAALRGTVSQPGEPGYNEARTIWNAMIDRKPAVVARCANAGDVAKAVDFAREHGLLVAVKGGGHNIAGNAVCEAGLLIDLSAMKSVHVDAGEKRARVEPGVTLGEFDAKAQEFGLATPLGINSTTGVAGLTLGGGFGWISRKHGMSIDNLVSADVVTASGKLVRASAEENPDLFWALRGGGGNFGVVTSFEFRLHPVGPEVLSGLIVHPGTDAPALFDAYRDFAANSPDELTTWVVLRGAPPLPFLPEEWHGKAVMVFAACYAGDMAEGEKALAPLRAVGNPIADVIAPHPFTGWQAGFDPLLTPGARNYWKSHDFAALTDAAVGKIVEYADNLPSPESEIFIAQMGGATSRVAKDATAYPNRDAKFIMNVHTRWQDAAEDEHCVAWARKFFAETKPFATGGVYVNFLTEDEGDRLNGAYGGNLKRLAAVKAAYDPGNLFRLNHNIKPS